MGRAHACTPLDNQVSPAAIVSDAEAKSQQWELSKYKQADKTNAGGDMWPSGLTADQKSQV